MKTRLYLQSAIALFCILSVYTLFNNKLLVEYRDETIYMSNVARLEQFGLSKRFFAEYDGAAGPLYTFVHFIFKPLTNLQLPYTRYINICFLFLLIIVLNYVYGLINSIRNKTFGWQLLAIPTTSISAGLALTELPAMFFLWSGIASILLFEQEKKIFVKWLLLISAALLISIAILGRQVYIVILLPLCIYFLQNKTNYIYLISFIVLILIMPLSLFYMWGGILATHDRAIIETGLAPNHVLLAFGYGFLFMIFLDVKLLAISFSFQKILAIAITFLLSSIANYFYLKLNFLPNKALLWKIIPNIDWQYNIGFLFGSLVIWFSAYFMFIFLKKSWYQRKNSFILLCNISFFLLLLTCIKIAHVFGSRYVFQAIPFLLFTFPFNYHESKKQLIMLILGFSMGIISLHLTK